MEALADLPMKLGMPTTLREVDVAASGVKMLAMTAMEQTRLLPNNPREVLLDDARRLYAAAL